MGICVAQGPENFAALSLSLKLGRQAPIHSCSFTFGGSMDPVATLLLRPEGRRIPQGWLSLTDVLHCLHRFGGWIHRLYVGFKFFSLGGFWWFNQDLQRF